jgi:protein TonB
MEHLNISVKEGRAGWLKAATAALVINLILLSVLPVVNLGTLMLPKTPPSPQPVNFVRLVPPEATRPDFPEPRGKKTLPPESASLQTPDAISLSRDSLDRTLRPDLQAIAVHAGVPRLTDISLATVDFEATGMDGVFTTEELDSPLVTVSRMSPFYPLQARRASIEGWVEIKFLVNLQGRVEDIRIIDAQPPGVFEESVRQTVSGWRFHPGTVMGEPVRARVTTTVRFELEDNP